MTFTSLASSSKGNAYVVDDGQTRLLLECGITHKQLKQRLDFDLSGIAACLITHEHNDHSKCFHNLIKDGIKVYSSEGTAVALDSELIETLVKREVVEIGTFSVLPFEVFHDAAEPFGYLIRSNVTGEKLLFAIDTVNLAITTPRLSYVAIECNYSAESLSMSTKLPEKTIDRIKNTHFEIESVVLYLTKLDLSHCKTIYLMHLSDAHSNVCKFKRMVEEACPCIEVVVCEK